MITAQDVDAAIRFYRCMDQYTTYHRWSYSTRTIPGFWPFQKDRYVPFYPDAGAAAERCKNQAIGWASR